MKIEEMILKLDESAIINPICHPNLLKSINYHKNEVINFEIKIISKK